LEFQNWPINEIKMNKFKYIFCILIMTFTNAFAWVEWNHITGNSHSWNNPQNWGGIIPTLSTDPIIRGQGSGHEAVIDSSVSATGCTMWMGYSGQADLTISGGTVTVGSDIVLGDSAPGIATMIMTDGSFNHTSGWLYVGFNGANGTINLHGGTLTTFKVLLSSANAHMDITHGKLIITNPDSIGVISEINGYVQSGRLTFFNGNPQAAYKATVNAQGHTEITASKRAADVYNPSPANNSTGVSRNPTISWLPGTTSKRVLPALIDFKNDQTLCEFSGTAIYSTQFNVSDNQRTLLSLGEVFGISEVTLNGINLGHRWFGEHNYDVSNALIIGTNVLEIKVITTLSNYFSVWENPVAQIWTTDRQPVSEGMVGPVLLLKQE